MYRLLEHAWAHHVQTCRSKLVAIVTIQGDDGGGSSAIENMLKDFQQND